MQESFMVIMKSLEVLVEKPPESLMVINLIGYNSTRLIVQQVTNPVLNAEGMAVHKTNIPCSRAAYFCIGKEIYAQLINKMCSVSEEHRCYEENYSRGGRKRL